MVVITRKPACFHSNCGGDRALNGDFIDAASQLTFKPTENNSTPSGTFIAPSIATEQIDYLPTTNSMLKRRYQAMCDYSLLGMPNRLAVEGEELVVHRFPTLSLGLTTPSGLQVLAETEVDQKRSSFWSTIKNWFVVEPVQSALAVCIPPGARLFLQDIPQHLQRELDVAECEEVTFTQLSAQPNTYRDAVRFNNGREVLLQKLEPEQRVKVLCLSLPDEVVEQPMIGLSHAHRAL